VKPKPRPPLSIRFTDSTPGWFSIRECTPVGDALLKLPEGTLKVYYSFAFLPEPFDTARFIPVEWKPVGNRQEYADDWWGDYYAMGRAFVLERTGDRGEDAPFWCLGVDFIPKNKGTKA
jgi:hypothetical protein